MTRSPINYTPAILLVAVTLLFALTWAHDVPAQTSCAEPARTTIRRTEPRYPATTGLFTSGRAALRRSVQPRPVADPPAGPAVARDWLAPLLKTASRTEIAR
jgi:hypothetical protein